MEHYKHYKTKFYKIYSLLQIHLVQQNFYFNNLKLFVETIYLIYLKKVENLNVLNFDQLNSSLILIRMLYLLLLHGVKISKKTKNCYHTKNKSVQFFKVLSVSLEYFSCFIIQFIKLSTSEIIPQSLSLIFLLCFYLPT